MKFRLAGIGIVLYVATSMAFAAGPAPGLYGSDLLGNLFLINTTNASTTPIGGSVTLLGATTEIEYDNIGGTAFSQSNDGSFQGNFFDMTTGLPTSGSISNGGSHTGLEYVGSTLYGAKIVLPAGPSTLDILVPSTGATSSIGLTGVGPISGLAYDVANSIMYGIAGGLRSGTSTFYTINLSNGVATSIFSTSFQAGSLQFGLDGNLYAGGSGGSGGLLYRINLSNNTDTLVGATGYHEITGLTLVVPEPSSLILAALGLIGLGVYGWRRRR